MEIYTLDALFRRDQLIDDFESLIWTERYNVLGDFQMTIVSTLRARNLFKTGVYLAMNESYYVMRVETVENAVDEDGRHILTVKGRTLEGVLEDRVARGTNADLTLWPRWTITDTPAAIARKIFHDICVTGILDPNDVLPYVVESTFMPESTIPEPIDPITADFDPMSVYEIITQICSAWNLGFRMLRQGDDAQIYWDVYSGSDRTTAQTSLPPVVFTPELDNLQNTKELMNIQGSKNVAYVCSPVGVQFVYAAGVDPEVEGFERRVLVVNANDITEDTADPETALIQRGNDELAKYRTYQGFDGEISQSSQFKPGRDYSLGDVVEQRNTDGATNNMRITEIIYVSDAEGERSYPTLTINQFINTGSWLSWLNNKVWSDMTTEVWADQP